MADRERQLGIEGAQRSRIALLAIAAGSLYLLGQLLLLVLIGSKEPGTGLLQGLYPALHGLKEARVDPRAIDERFLDKHAIENILSWVVTAAGLVVMAWPLRYLCDAEAVRSGRQSRIVPFLSSYAPPLVGLAALVLAISDAIGAHKFVTHAVQNTAALDAATGGAFRGTLDVLYLLGYFGLAVVFIMVSVRAMGAGLLTRLLGILGIIAGVLFVIPLVPLPLIQFLWLAGIGMMLRQLGGMTMPPAWAAGQAIPWVSAASQRAAQRRASQPARRGARREPAAPVPTPPPAPSQVASKKRKRRRRA